MDWPCDRPISAAPTGSKNRNSSGVDVGVLRKDQLHLQTPAVIDPELDDRADANHIRRHCRSGQTSARSSSPRSAADTSGTPCEAAVAIAVKRFSSPALIRMCGSESIVASMDIGNLIALDTAALRKERLAQTPGQGSCERLVVRPHRYGGADHGDQIGVPGARKKRCAGARCLRRQFQRGKSQMKGHFAGHGP